MFVLLDRDGVINVDGPVGVLKLEEFVFLPRSIDAIVRLTQAGYRIAVCTNQSAIGKGWMSEDTLHVIHHYMRSEVEKQGGKIEKIYYAPDHPDVPSTRRKPAPGMLLEALAHFGADPARTPMVGDMMRDLEAAIAAGCPRILTRTGKGAALEASGIPEAIAPVTVCDDLYDAVTYILANYR